MLGIYSRLHTHMPGKDEMEDGTEGLWLVGWLVGLSDVPEASD